MSSTASMPIEPTESPDSVLGDDDVDSDVDDE